MASSYSTNLRIELQAQGEGDSVWGTKANTGFQLLEAAIAGRAAVTHDDTANYTLTTANGSADEARRMILNIGGALSAARNVVVPTQTKFYIVKNATTGGYAVTIKTSGGTGIAVPNGKTMMLFCDGTNVVEAIDQIVGTLALTSPDITTSITTSSTSFTAFAGATTLLTIGGTGASASAFFPSTLDATSSITGAIRTSGGISAAKTLNIGTTGTFGGLITANTGISVSGLATLEQIITAKGSTASILTATPTTIITVGTQQGTFYVTAYIQSAGAAYTATATVISEASAPRILANDGANLTLTLSGTNVQVTQTSGSNQVVKWSYFYQPAG